MSEKAFHVREGTWLIQPLREAKKFLFSFPIRGKKVIVYSDEEERNVWPCLIMHEAKGTPAQSQDLSVRGKKNAAKRNTSPLPITDFWRTPCIYHRHDDPGWIIGKPSVYNSSMSSCVSRSLYWEDLYRASHRYDKKLHESLSRGQFFFQIRLLSFLCLSVLH